MPANKDIDTIMDLFSNIETTEREELLTLRKELAEANYKYYVENAPTLSDYEFDQKLRRLQDYTINILIFPNLVGHCSYL